MAELRHGSGLDLAYPVAGQLELLADLFEGPGLAPVEAETKSQDRRSRSARGARSRGISPGHQRLGRGSSTLVGDDVTELLIAILGECQGQARRRFGELLHGLDLAIAPVESGSRLGGCGLPAEGSFQFVPYLPDSERLVPAWIGSRIVRALLPMPRVMA
jgi:hypothetical protein